MLEKDNAEISLKVQTELLDISYSSLFYEPVPPSARELVIKRRIDEIYTACSILWLTKNCGFATP
jgi:putative transposase